MSQLVVDYTRLVHKAIKRMEKRGIITAKIEGANYRKVKILVNKKDPLLRKVVFISRGGIVISSNIYLLDMAADPAQYLKNWIGDICMGIEESKRLRKEAA